MLLLSFVCRLVVLVFGFVFYMVKLQGEPDNESDNMPESAWKYLLQPGGSGVDGGETFRLWLHAEFRECAQLAFCRASALTAYFITSLLGRLLAHGVNLGARITLKCAPQLTGR